MPTLRILSADDIRQAVTMPDAIRLMREAFIALSTGRMYVPVRMNMTLSEHGEGRVLFMPVYSPSHHQVAQKVVAVHPENAHRNLPFIHALVLLIDAATGRFLAVMDGEFITALRTGAGAGLATDLLAAPDASTLAIFGAGVQARTQLAAVLAVRSLQKVIVFGRTPERAAEFAQEASAAYGLEVSVARFPEELAEAEVICTATTSLMPVFDDAHVRSGAHINGIGSYRPDMTEIPSDTVCRARVFVDQRKAALQEAGDLAVPIRRGLIDARHIRAELGEVALGTAVGRRSPEDVTFFKSVGNAAQDLVVASRAFDLACKRGLGTVATV